MLLSAKPLIDSIRRTYPVLRACQAIVAAWVATCFYVGRISLIRPFFVAISTLALVGVVCLFMGMGRSPVDYARSLIKLALVLCMVGGFAVMIHRRRSDGVDVVIDQIVGQLLLLAFAFPGVIYAYFAVHSVLSYMCNLYLFCEWYVYYLAYIVGLLIPLLLFNAFLYLRPWPISWLDQEARNTVGTMLNDIIAAFYSLIVFYLLGFIFMRANIPASYNFILQLLTI